MTVPFKPTNDPKKRKREGDLVDDIGEKEAADTESQGVNLLYLINNQ